MVEYAMLLAGTAIHSFAARVSNFADSVNWTYVGYVVAALVALKLASLAFRPTR